MSLILYPKNETAFDTNGIGILSDVIDDEVYEELNGQCELTVQYPVDGLHFADIVKEAIITAKPDPVTDPQPFFIYRITKPMDGVVNIYARHVAYKNKKIVVSPFSAASVSDALQSLKNNAVNACPFEFWTDKSTAAEMKVTAPKDIWTLLGNSQGSILDIYGGEYEFDRWKVKLHSRRGADRGVSIRYGKNLTSLEQDENCSNCYTGVYPYWTDSNGTLVQLPEKIVSAQGTHDEEQILPLDLSMEFETQPTEEQLRTRAEKYVTDNDIGKPDISWTVEFVQLEQTEEYKGTALLERVLLGDTVSVVFPKLNVDVSARAVAVRYKPSLGRYKSITLGKVKSNIADTIVQKAGKEEYKKAFSSYLGAVASLTSTILGANGGAVRILDTDGDGLNDTLYIADNPDPELAVKVWRFNYEGWAGSKTGYNGPFIMGATLKDGLLAAAVTAAHLVAGTIKSADGKTFFLDLDNGILKADFTELSISGKTVDAIAQGKVDAMTQADIFNKLTNNGALQGFYIQNGKLYINAEFVSIINLVADTLKSIDGNVGVFIDGAKIRLSYNAPWEHGSYVDAVAIWNYGGNDNSVNPIAYFKDWVKNTSTGYMEEENVTEISPHHFRCGGKQNYPLFEVSTSSGRVKITADNEKLVGAVESWTTTLSNSGSSTHTCSRTPVAVIVGAQYQGTGLVTGIWTPETSGLENSMYGATGGYTDVWPTTVTISGKTVTVKRGGSASLKYFVTAIMQMD